MKTWMKWLAALFGVALYTLVIVNIPHRGGFDFAVSTARADTPYPPWLQDITGDITFSATGASTTGASKITSAKILDETIASADILDGSVTTSDLVAPAITEGHYVERIAVVQYDVATDLGVIGAYNLGVALPAKTNITQGWYQIITQFTDGGVGTVALHCEDANNILTATDITGIAANTITTLAATGSAATMVKAIASACNITATVGGADQTAGKLVAFIRYFVGNN